MAEEATESQDEKQIWGTVVACVLVIIVLFVLYVLSVGPMLCLMVAVDAGGSEVAGKAFYGFYFPLIYACEQSEVAEAAIEVYVAWWMELAGVNW